MSVTRTVPPFRFKKPIDQLIFETIGFIIIDEAGFSASLDVVKSLV
jgi:hypothetical protein